MEWRGCKTKTSFYN